MQRLGFGNAGFAYSYGTFDLAESVAVTAGEEALAAGAAAGGWAILGVWVGTSCAIG